MSKSVLYEKENVTTRREIYTKQMRSLGFWDIQGDLKHKGWGVLWESIDSMSLFYIIPKSLSKLYLHETIA